MNPAGLAALLAVLALTVAIGGSIGTLLVFALIREVTAKPK